MRLSVRVESLVLVAAFSYIVGGLMSPGSSRANAAPADVRGSSNICVASYRNANGSYVVWADGHITEAKTNREVERRTEWPMATGFVEPKLAVGQAKGSPHVAVGVTQNSEGSYIQFSDGVARKPVSNEASAAPLDARRVVWGVLNYERVMSGSKDFVLEPRLSVYVKFDKPFTTPPAVTISGDPGDARVRDVTGAGFLIMSRENTPILLRGQSYLSFVATGPME